MRLLEGVGADASSAAAALAEGGDDVSSAVASGEDRSGDAAEGLVGALFADLASANNDWKVAVLAYRLLYKYIRIKL